MKKRTMIALPLAVSMLGLLLSGCGKKIDVNQFATTAAAPAATQAAGGAADAGAAPAAGTEAAAPKPKKAAESAYAKSDFIPGDEIFFEDDFAGGKKN